MREIIFKGKTLDWHNWVEGDLEYRRKSELAFIHTYWGDGHYKAAFEVDPDTVCQYTGLTDHNGKRIFEGDILNQGGGYFGVVMWHPNGYFCINDRKIEQLTANDSFAEIGYMLRRHAFEVSGNIHDEQKGGDQ